MKGRMAWNFGFCVKARVFAVFAVEILSSLGFTPEPSVRLFSFIYFAAVSNPVLAIASTICSNVQEIELYQQEFGSIDCDHYL